MEPIIVTGAGSTGTSIVAGVLKRLGVCMGFTMVPGTPHNPKGHYEDLEFQGLHDFRQTHPEAHDAWEKELSSLIHRRKSLHRPWGFKHPKTIYFYRTYRRLVPNARWIVCERDWEGIVDSFDRAGWGNLPMIKERIELCEKHLAHATWYKFEEMLAHPFELVEHINERFQLGASDLQKENAFRFVEYKPMSKKDNSIAGNKEASKAKSSFHTTNNPKKPSTGKKKIHTKVQN